MRALRPRLYLKGQEPDLARHLKLSFAYASFSPSTTPTGQSQKAVAKLLGTNFVKLSFVGTLSIGPPM